MRTAFLVCLVVAAAYQSASATEINLRAGSSGAWAVSGPAPEVVNGGLKLPAGGRFDRSFASNNVSVRLATNPVFGTEAEDWPIIEIGSAALAFVRSGTEGKVVLLVGQATPVTLPHTFKLDASGRPLEPVALEFGVRGSVASVVYGNEVTNVSFEATPVLEIAVSAGGHEPWNFSRFVLQGMDDVATATTDRRPPAKSSAADSGKVSTRQAGTTPVFVASTGQRDEGQVKSTSLAATQNKGMAASPLEVFTPPSVRQRLAERLSNSIPKTDR